MSNTVNLWDQVNANAFYKVNAFGPDLQFWFTRKQDAEYTSPVGKVTFWGDEDVVLQVTVEYNL